MRLTLVVNPFASSVTRRARVVIQKRLAAHHDLDVIETTKGGHAIRLAHGAGRAGAEVVLSLGGDGTVNEVANGLLDSGVAIAPLPGGSTNVFARSLGYPNDPIEACDVILDALVAGSIRSAGVGLAGNRAFLFHVGAGFDAAVVERVERRGPAKRFIGHPLFVASTVFTWLRGVDRRSRWFRVETDDGRRIDGAQLAVALNTNPYTYLGRWPLDLAPGAGLDTPLSVVSLTSLSIPKLVPAVLAALRGSDGIVDRGHDGPTRRLDGVVGADLVGFRPFPYQIDGESMPATSRLRLDHRPNAIRLVVPPPSDDGSTAGG